MSLACNISAVALLGKSLPAITGTEKLALPKLLALVNSRSGIVLAPNGAFLSLPFTSEIDDNGPFIRSHFPGYRSETLNTLKQLTEVEVLFDCGEYYVDPSWVKIDRPHGPTEIKLLFTIKGALQFIDCTTEEAVDHLDKVTKFRQARFRPDSTLDITAYPSAYYDWQLPQIQHLQIRPTQIHVSHIMALLHLNQEQRAYVMDRLDEREEPGAREAAQILRLFP